MSIHLVGGGRNGEHAISVYGAFVAEATGVGLGCGRLAPRVAVVLVVQDTAAGEEQLDRFARVLSGVGACEVVPVVVKEGLELASLPTELDGLLVGGGLAPAYATALAPVAGEIRDLVLAGVPYAGFSAGAALASRRAIVGGWRIRDLAICHEDNAEDLDQLTVVPGLALTEVSVDVHAAQWGNLARLIMAVRTGAVSVGVGIDEDTVLILDSRGNEVRGAGQVWTVVRREQGVQVINRAADTAQLR
jgi:cyanophycinase